MKNINAIPVLGKKGKLFGNFAEEFRITWIKMVIGMVIKKTPGIIRAFTIEYY